MLKRLLQRWLGIQELSDKLARLEKPRVYYQAPESVSMNTTEHVPIEKGYESK